MIRLTKMTILSFIFVASLGVNSAVAAEVDVTVLDKAGKPVPDVAVFIKQSGLQSTADQTPAPAIMDQRDMRFVPHILIVEQGSLVEFPNSDTVAHHVYSFSRPNNFVLPLYKGTPPSPIDFATEGVVTVGCNIHDGMLGYIIVVDTNVFGMTDVSGKVSLEVDDESATYEINIWSPRIRDSKSPIQQTFSTIPADGVTFNIQKSLRRAHVDNSEAVQWDEY